MLGWGESVREVLPPLFCCASSERAHSIALLYVYPLTAESLQGKYMTKEWEPKHHKLAAEAARKLAEFDADNPTVSNVDLVRMCILILSDV